MSDYWSGIFLVGIIVLAIPFLLIALLAILFRKNNRRLNTSMFAIIVTLILIWVGDRFIVGYFCFPWECTRREIGIETLLLDTADMPENWSVSKTFNYAYVPRASSAYVERIFHNDSKLLNDEFYQEIYQYRSVRGASFQYDALKDDLPEYYSGRGEPVISQVKLPVSHAASYVAGCIYAAPSICYYVAH